MKKITTPVQEYLAAIPADRSDAFEKLFQTISENTTELSQEMSYGMLGFVVPRAIYPAGYHCNTTLSLPFISIASQKNSINFYHMGLYASPELHDWFTAEYAKVSTLKLDMGKSCIRFKKWDQIPFDLIGQLCKKMTTEQWIQLYETEIKK